MSTRVILADDHGIVRDGLRALLGQLRDIEVVAEADNGRTAVELAKKHRPDLVILDVSMPDLNGIEAARHIHEAVPTARIIGLSMHADKRFVAEMLRAGASGYVLKDAAFEELHQAIASVMNGQIYLCRRIAGVVVEDYMRRLDGEGPVVPASELSAREREVLQLLAEGKTTKQIALTLHLSPKTIESHRHNIMNKLKIDNVAELTKYAIREGLTSTQD
jgi:DNA-binding NarL/FixJ family response regulator